MILDFRGLLAARSVFEASRKRCEVADGGLANRGKVALASAVRGCVRGSQCIKEQPRPGQQVPENFKTAETVDCQTTEAYSGSYLQTLQCRLQRGTFTYGLVLWNSIKAKTEPST